jgi:hypothetical protein
MEVAARITLPPMMFRKKNLRQSRMPGLWQLRDPAPTDDVFVRN